MDINAFPTASTRRVPAWLLSAGLHVTLLVACGLLFRSSQPMAAVTEDRPVGIALVEQDAETITYTDASEDREQSPAKPAPAAPDRTWELPDAAAMPLASVELSLPRAAVVTPPPDTLVARPTLSSGGKARLPSGQDNSDILAEEAARRKAAAQLGPTAEVSLFGSAPAVGRSFIFVIDRSQSMGRGGLNALAAAEVQFAHALANLQPSHKFQILAYNHQRVFFGDEKWVSASAQYKNQVGEFMRGLAAFGGTDHQLGLSSALYRQPDVIFLLTDGGDPPLSPSQLAEIRKRAGGRTTIHCIRFGPRAWQGGENFMEQLAQQNGGSYRYVDMSRLLGHSATHLK